MDDAEARERMARASLRWAEHGHILLGTAVPSGKCHAAPAGRGPAQGAAPGPGARGTGGVPLATVQRILRHSDPAITTEVYGHLDVEDMRKGINQLDFHPPHEAATE